MKSILLSPTAKLVFTILLAVLILPALALAHEPDYTDTFDRSHCTFATTGSNPYFPLWPGYALHLEGEEEDDEGEMVDITATITVLPDTEMVDGILTRVVEELETEDGEIVEISRNFMAQCRETGDVWYFGEDVDDYEDGVVVGHGGAWRAGMNGARAGILMPGSPLVGARYFQEVAPGVALDRGEIVSLDEEATVPAGSFENVLAVFDTDALDPGEPDEKLYAPGVGLIVDEELELVTITSPPCQPSATTHCLNNGRFRVQVAWGDFGSDQGNGNAILASGESGEFWFFDAGNTELLVKVLDACNSSFNSYWVFAAGLTNVEVALTVTDTQSGQTMTYDNTLGNDFAPILDTTTFATCP